MPMYTYRRQDGTLFDVRQKFTDEPLTTDPATGQSVVRVVQSAGIIFKGSGFYVTDSKGSTRSSTPASTTASKEDGGSKAETVNSETKAEAKSEPKSEAKSESKSTASAAAD